MTHITIIKGYLHVSNRKCKKEKQTPEFYQKGSQFQNEFIKYKNRKA